VWLVPTTDSFAYIDRRAVHLRSFGPWPRRRLLGVRRVVRTQLADLLRDAGRNGTAAQHRLHVLVGSSLCRFLLLDNTRRLKGDAEVLALAAGLLKERLGLDPAEWTYAVDRNWDRSAVVCAVRSALLAELSASAAAGQCRLVSIRPWIAEWLQAANRRMSTFRTLGVVEPDSASLVVQRPSATQVHTLPLNEGGDPLAALRHLAQSADGTTLSPPIVRFDPMGEVARVRHRQRNFSDLTTLMTSPS
jgi:hypothetical protein